LLLVLSLPAAAGAQQPGAKSGKTAEPEEVQEVQEVSAVEVQTQKGWTDLVGRMHPAVVHFPIGWMVLLLAVEGVAFLTGNAEWSRAGFVLLAAAAASFVPAAVTGFLRASAMGSDPEFVATMVLHRNLNIGAAAACFIALALRFAGRGNFRGPSRLAYLLLVALGTFLVLFAGHLCGKMVFGKDYLPF
jgi:uncharacterized membrane protein